MKKLVVSLMLIASLSLAGCKTPPNSTSETTPSETAMTVNTPAPTTVAPDEEVDVGSYGTKSYTLVLQDPTGKITTYKGMTEMLDFMSLCQEIQDKCDKFSYVIAPAGAPIYFDSINGQKANEGYYAVYINGRLISDFGVLTQNTMISNGAVCEIRYTTDNVFYESGTYIIPSDNDIYKVTIIEMTDDKTTETYTFFDTGSYIEYSYSIEVVDGEIAYSYGTLEATTEQFEKAKQTVLNLEDIQVLGTEMTDPNTTKKFLVVLNDYMFLTDAPELLDYVNTLDKPLDTPEE